MSAHNTVHAPEKCRTSDDLVRAIREQRQRVIKQCAKKAATKILAELGAMAKRVDGDVLAELIANEFLALGN